MTIQRTSFVVLAIICLLSLANAQQSKTQHEPALDINSMDHSIDPCVDFFAFSCGGWIKNNPIPPDQSSWDLYSKMEDENKTKLRAILEAASAPDAGPLRRRCAPNRPSPAYRLRVRPRRCWSSCKPILCRSYLLLVQSLAFRSATSLPCHP